MRNVGHVLPCHERNYNGYVFSDYQPIMGTKEDIPDISIDQYEDMMGGDPYDIVQTRVPDENPFEKVYFETSLPLSMIIIHNSKHYYSEK